MTNSRYMIQFAFWSLQMNGTILENSITYLHFQFTFFKKICKKTAHNLTNFYKANFSEWPNWSWTTLSLRLYHFPICPCRNVQGRTQSIYYAWWRPPCSVFSYYYAKGGHKGETKSDKEEKSAETIAKLPRKL